MSKGKTWVLSGISAAYLLMVGSSYAGELPPGFNVYFNDAQHSQSNGIDTALVAFIDSADETVDGAFYSISRTSIVDAFIHAANRLGTSKVRIITDAGNRNSTGCRRLEAAGITVIDETCDGWDDDALESHHKFCVVDGIKVWTGSYNITDSGTLYNNNNALAIECEELAQAYQREFNEMWGADSGAPGDCHFSTHKSPQSETHFVCSGVPVDVYFSPTTNPEPDRALDAILNEMNNAETSFQFCMFAFTSYPIGSKVVQLHQRGLTVQGVLDADQSEFSSSQYTMMKNAGVDVILDESVDPHGSLLHHKFGVIDYQSTDAVVITGSYNWSTAAQFTNDENSLFIHNQEIARRFYDESYRCYHGKDPEENELVIDISMNQTTYYPGNFFRVAVAISNTGPQRSVDEYILLDLGELFGTDRFFFWPGWSEVLDFETILLSEGARLEQPIFQFVLPSDLPSSGPFTFWAGLLDTGTATLACPIDFVSFRFSN